MGAPRLSLKRKGYDAAVIGQWRLRSHEKEETDTMAKKTDTAQLQVEQATQDGIRMIVKRHLDAEHCAGVSKKAKRHLDKLHPKQLTVDAARGGLLRRGRDGQGNRLVIDGSTCGLRRKLRL